MAGEKGTHFKTPISLLVVVLAGHVSHRLGLSHGCGGELVVDLAHAGVIDDLESSGTMKAGVERPDACTRSCSSSGSSR